MNVLFNGESVEVSASNLAECLVLLGVSDQHIATAVNGEFVPRSQRHQLQLTEGDRLEVVSPMQGG